jgi:hypothetical protein
VHPVQNLSQSPNSQSPSSGGGDINWKKAIEYGRQQIDFVLRAHVCDILEREKWRAKELISKFTIARRQLLHHPLNPTPSQFATLSKSITLSQPISLFLFIIYVPQSYFSVRSIPMNLRKRSKFLYLNVYPTKALQFIKSVGQTKIIQPFITHNHMIEQPIFSTCF